MSFQSAGTYMENCNNPLLKISLVRVSISVFIHSSFILQQMSEDGVSGVQDARPCRIHQELSAEKVLRAASWRTAEQWQVAE
jgi:hypothetical protein